MWHTQGHERAVRILQRSLDNGSVSHAYLILGPQQIGKMRLASDLTAALNCLGHDRPCGECSQCSRIDKGIHADVHLISLATSVPEGGLPRVAIGIDRIKQVQRETNFTPYEGRFRVIIVDGAEHLSEEASNSLLKTLEEPPDRVVILVLATNTSQLLPTLISRCQVLELRPVPTLSISELLQAEYGANKKDADQIARLSDGKPGWAINAVKDHSIQEELNRKLENIERVSRGDQEARFQYASTLATAIAKDRDSGRKELRLWLQWWRDVLLVTEGASELVTHLSRIETLKVTAEGLTPARASSVIKAIQDTLRHLESNVNSRLALESLMLTLPIQP